MGPRTISFSPLPQTAYFSEPFKDKIIQLLMLYNTIQVVLYYRMNIVHEVHTKLMPERKSINCLTLCIVCSSGICSTDAGSTAFLSCILHHHKLCYLHNWHFDLFALSVLKVISYTLEHITMFSNRLEGVACILVDFWSRVTCEVEEWFNNFCYDN